MRVLSLRDNRIGFCPSVQEIPVLKSTNLKTENFSLQNRKEEMPADDSLPLSKVVNVGKVTTHR